MSNIKLIFEIKRKIFHCCSIIFPILYIFISKFYMLAILIIITTSTIFIDILREYHQTLQSVTNKIFGHILRSSEKSSKFDLSGASYMSLGFLLSCILCTKYIAITAWLVLIISDCFAAVIGTKFGKPLFNGKSYLGSFVFFVSSITLSITVYFIIGNYTSINIIVISSLITTIIEFFSSQIKVNDNLLIPLTYGLSITILNSIM